MVFLINASLTCIVIVTVFDWNKLMETGTDTVFVKLPTVDKKATLIKWRVKEGTLVNSTAVVLLYQEDGETERKSFRTNHIGVVKKILIHEGQDIPPGYIIPNRLLFTNQ